MPVYRERSITSAPLGIEALSLVTLFTLYVPNPSIRGVGAPMDGLSALPWTARWCQGTLPCCTAPILITTRSEVSSLPTRGGACMEDDEITRRDFVSMTVGAGIAAATAAQASAQQRVVDTNVEIKTADGTCEAAVIHPATG